jgi:hypothetical protein
MDWDFSLDWRDDADLTIDCYEGEQKRKRISHVSGVGKLLSYDQ